MHPLLPEVILGWEKLGMIQPGTVETSEADGTYTIFVTRADGELIKKQYSGWDELDMGVKLEKAMILKKMRGA